jgi:hypothetical protein
MSSPALILFTKENERRVKVLEDVRLDHTFDWLEAFTIAISCHVSKVEMKWDVEEDCTLPECGPRSVRCHAKFTLLSTACQRIEVS